MLSEPTPGKIKYRLALVDTTVIVLDVVISPMFVPKDESEFCPDINAQ
jgi:hypothetical protein